jgi:predicted glycoside hydrolase/deacetylase ChbG (UPF0249 family)
VTPRAFLVVNADDLGCSPGVNRGIFEAHARGIVTSASLMVRRPAAPAAVRQAPAGLGLGLHVDLGEWVYADGEWVARELVAGDDADAVAAEAVRQLARFRQLARRDPTHLDSHQHAHRNEPARSALLGLAAELGVPLRHESGIRYCGLFYGQDDVGNPLPELLRPERLEAILRSLPDGPNELCCHPGYAAGLDSTYAAERELELGALCDPRLRPALAEEGVELVTFAELAVRGAA